MYAHVWISILLYNFMAVFLSSLSQDTPFDNPEITMVDTISQAIGSPDFTIFQLYNDETSRNSVPYPVLSITIWIVFGVCISVLFITFLVRVLQFCLTHPYNTYMILIVGIGHVCLCCWFSYTYTPTNFSPITSLYTGSYINRSHVWPVWVYIATDVFP